MLQNALLAAHAVGVTAVAVGASAWLARRRESRRAYWWVRAFLALVTGFNAMLLLLALALVADRAVNAGQLGAIALTFAVTLVAGEWTFQSAVEGRLTSRLHPVGLGLTALLAAAAAGASMLSIERSVELRLAALESEATECLRLGAVRAAPDASSSAAVCQRVAHDLYGGEESIAQNELVAILNSVDPTDAELSLLATTLADAAAALDEVVAAARVELRDFEAPTQALYEDAAHNEIVQLVQLLVIRARARALDGRLDEALDELAAASLIGEQFRAGAALWQLRSLVVQRTWIVEAGFDLLASPAATVATIDALDALDAQLWRDLGSRLPAALELARARTVLDVVADERDEVGGAEWFASRAWRLLGLERELDRLDEVFTSARELAAAAPNDPTRFRELVAAHSRLSGQSRLAALRWPASLTADVELLHGSDLARPHIAQARDLLRQRWNGASDDDLRAALLPGEQLAIGANGGLRLLWTGLDGESASVDVLPRNER
ncbi:MAG: hypothetical protein JNN27_23950 [Planctomycetes bacterium]|nr:hypothetical protein [Planctomycetota bacterium]